MKWNLVSNFEWIWFNPFSNLPILENFETHHEIIVIAGDTVDFDTFDESITGSIIGNCEA